MLQGEQKKRGVANIISLFGDTNNQMNLFKGKRFNLILGSNLIEKLNDPTKWILQSKVNTILTHGNKFYYLTYDKKIIFRTCFKKMVC